MNNWVVDIRVFHWTDSLCKCVFHQIILKRPSSSNANDQNINEIMLYNFTSFPRKQGRWWIPPPFIVNTAGSHK